MIYSCNILDNIMPTFFLACSMTARRAFSRSFLRNPWMSVSLTGSSGSNVLVALKPSSF